MNADAGAENCRMTMIGAQRWPWVAVEEEEEVVVEVVEVVVEAAVSSS